MAYAETETITVTTDASGEATVLSTKDYTGTVRLIKYTKTNYEDTADFTITSVTTGQTLWAQSNVTASTSVCPKQATHLNTTGVAATYDGTRAALDDIVLAGEKISIVVAQGGNVKTGAFRVVVG